MDVNALVLDFGEVLVRAPAPEAVRRLAVLAGLDEEEFRRRYWRWRLDYDRGVLSDDAYWRRVIDGTGADGGDHASITEALADADFESWSDYREDMWDLAAAFKRRGGRTAILSNGPPSVISL